MFATLDLISAMMVGRIVKLAIEHKLVSEDIYRIDRKSCHYRL